MNGTETIKKNKLRRYPTYKPLTINSPIPFGKYQGVKFKTLVEKNLPYINWALREVKSFRLDKHAKLLLEQHNNKKKATD